MAQAMNVTCGCDEGTVFDGMSAAYRRVLWTVILINFAMFAVEMVAGVYADSLALQADALDFLGDSVTYAISWFVLAKPPLWRARAALFKSLSLGAVGVWVFGSSLYHMLFIGQPEPFLMTWVAALALTANVISALLLFRFREGDANVRSVWICSRNDAIGNVAVVGAAGAVWLTGSGWPDVIVAAALAGLFLRGAVVIAVQGRAEIRALEIAAAEPAAKPDAA